MVLDSRGLFKQILSNQRLRLCLYLQWYWNPLKDHNFKQKRHNHNSQGNVIFDAKGKNLHFEVTGEGVLIEKITFRNFKFINNVARIGAGVYWTNAINGKIIDSTFIKNAAGVNGGGVSWGGNNGIITESTFTENTAANVGGGIDWWVNNCTVTKSTFTSNTATKGGAIWWNVAGSMANCNFINSKSQQNNGIYAKNNLKINNGNGIVYAFINGTLSGTSIVVLNNETYYYSPGENINLTVKK